MKIFCDKIEYCEFIILTIDTNISLLILSISGNDGNIL
jgi:hypothetical protein